MSKSPSLSMLLLKNNTVYGYVLFLVVGVLVISLPLFISGNIESASSLLKYTLIVGSIPLWYNLLRDIVRGSYGVDIIAGVALIGTFIINQYLAGVIVLLMLSGGQLLEVYAMSRAQKELSLLLSRTPTFAHQKIGDQINDIPVDKVQPGMFIVIKQREVVSVDGTIVDGETTIDESTLTGESIPRTKHTGASVYAGTENIGDVIVVEVMRPAKETRYHSIVALVKNAQKSKAPIVRLADTYSIYFTGITFVIALIAWVLSHDLIRVVAVLVVATPCPLLLATPIAIMSGMSRLSKKGVIVKDGGALETLARVDTFVFDKTGTITLGTPEVSSVVSFGEYSEEKILATASSLDQLSDHVFARALLNHAHSKNIKLIYPTYFKEHFGDGVSGVLHGQTYIFGKRSLMTKIPEALSEKIDTVSQAAAHDGTIVVYLSDEHSVIGAILFQDTVRTDARDLFIKLHEEGMTKTIILTGDKKGRATAVAKTLHVTDVISDCLPEDKLRHIKDFKNHNHVVAMVGDGINDTPALASADVGIALATHGQTAVSDIADIVILTQSIGQVYDVYHIARQTIRLAKQGILFGIGASTIAMIMSAYGYIPPLVGVILQEGIDVIVIINALRLGNTPTNH